MSYWVQIEFAPQGSNTGAMQIDLEQVKRVHIKRENKQVHGCVIKYADEPGFSIGAVEAESFLSCWADYIATLGGLHYKDDEAEPGLLVMAQRSDGTLRAV